MPAFLPIGSRISEYQRLLDDKAWLFRAKTIQEWIEKDSDLISCSPSAPLTMTARLGSSNWTRSIGAPAAGGSASARQRTDWGKGFGTDAMEGVLRYAFEELTCTG